MFLTIHNPTFYNHMKLSNNHCNIKWFYLHNLAICLYFISILVQHSNDGRQCNVLIIHDEAYFTSVHLLVHYLSVKQSSKQSLPFTSDQPCETIPHLTHACYMLHHSIIYFIALMMMFYAVYHL
jgi:hypothetical protein